MDPHVVLECVNENLSDQSKAPEMFTSSGDCQFLQSQTCAFSSFIELATVFLRFFTLACRILKQTSAQGFAFQPC